MGVPKPSDLEAVLLLMIWSKPINAPDARNSMFLVSIWRERFVEFGEICKLSNIIRILVDKYKFGTVS